MCRNWCAPTVSIPPTCGLSSGAGWNRNCPPRPNRAYDDGARAVLDQSVLQIMKGKAPQAAKNLKELSLGFAARQADRQPRIFWKIAAAYFEALANELLGSDIYVSARLPES
jgi:hypothetical protein